MAECHPRLAAALHFISRWLEAAMFAGLLCGLVSGAARGKVTSDRAIRNEHALICADLLDPPPTPHREGLFARVPAQPPCPPRPKDDPHGRR